MRRSASMSLYVELNFLYNWQISKMLKYSKNMNN